MVRTVARWPSGPLPEKPGPLGETRKTGKPGVGCERLSRILRKPGILANDRFRDESATQWRRGFACLENVVRKGTRYAQQSLRPCPRQRDAAPNRARPRLHLPDRPNFGPFVPETALSGLYDAIGAVADDRATIRRRRPPAQVCPQSCPLEG
jgi:hypothetical protein